MFGRFSWLFHGLHFGQILRILALENWKRLKGKNPEGKNFRKLLRRKQSSAKISKISRNTIKSSKNDIFDLLRNLLKYLLRTFFSSAKFSEVFTLCVFTLWLFPRKVFWVWLAWTCHSRLKVSIRGRDLGRGWVQKNSNFRVRRFTEWPWPLHWIAFSVEFLTKAFIHWMPCPGSVKRRFSSLTSALLHPLPQTPFQSISRLKNCNPGAPTLTWFVNLVLSASSSL